MYLENCLVRFKSDVANVGIHHQLEQVQNQTGGTPCEGEGKQEQTAKTSKHE